MMSSVVRPGQVMRWPRLIARMSVEGTGLPRAPWMKAARSAFVDADRNVLLARRGDEDDLGGKAGGTGGDNGI